MSLTSANRTAQLLLRLLDTKTTTEPIIQTEAQKPAVLLGRNSSPLPRSTPERQGISSGKIAAFLRELTEDPTLRMHSILLARSGKIICEKAFGAQNIATPRMTFSACKSITALAIGLLMDDGKLSADDRLVDLFPDEGNLVNRRLMKDLTVAHLLQMQTGNQFSEAASMTQTDWLHGFFSSASVTGSQKFHYNSLNTYVLARIVCQISGISLSEFLTGRLFAPMGITDFFWERCPQGYEKGGWGLYLRAEDLAKLGQLIIDGGLWEGKQLISQEFLAKATSSQVSTPESCGSYNYGWQFWVHRDKNIVLFNGMLGQNVMCFPDSGIVLVSHAGNEEVFQQSNYFTIAERYFSGDFPPSLPFDLQSRFDLWNTMRQISLPSLRVKKRIFQAFAEKELICTSENGASAGLLPLSLQVVHNCYTQGLHSVSIGGSKKHPVLIYREKGCTYEILLGTSRPCVQDVDFCGNVFRIAASAGFTNNEDGFPVARITLDFLETPFSRILKLFKTPTGFILQQSETPHMDQIINTALSTASAALRTLLSTMLGSGSEDYLQWKFAQVFSPTLTLSENKELLSQ